MFHYSASLFGLWPHPQSLSKQQPEELFKVQIGLIPPLSIAFQRLPTPWRIKSTLPTLAYNRDWHFLALSPCSFHSCLTSLFALPQPLQACTHLRAFGPSERILTLIFACLLFLLIPGLRSGVMSSMRASLTTLPKAVIPSPRTQFFFKNWSIYCFTYLLSLSPTRQRSWIS